MKGRRGASSAVRTQVGLVGKIRLGQHHRLLKWYSEAEDAWCCQPWAHAPGSTVLEVVVIRISTQPNQDIRQTPDGPSGRHLMKFSEAPSNCNHALQPVGDAVCHSKESLMNHRQSIRTRRPIRSWRHWEGEPQPQTSQMHGKRCHQMCHLLLVLSTCQTTEQIIHNLQHSFVVARCALQ